MARSVRSRNFVALLYPMEDKSHEMAMRILEASDLVWCAIVHDRDYEEDKTPKKAHTHVVIRFSSAQSLNGVSSRLGIAPNYLQTSSDVVSAFQYLCHCNDLDKFQYPDTEIFGSCADSARTYVLTARNTRFVPKLSESEAFGHVLDFLNSCEGFVSYQSACTWAVQNGLFGYFRQSYSIVRDLISEHNREYESKLLIDLRADNVHTDGFGAFVSGHQQGVKECRRKMHSMGQVPLF